MAIFPYSGDILRRDTCSAPQCLASAIPEMRIPVCKDCARSVTYQYLALTEEDRAAAQGSVTEPVLGRLGTDPGVVYFIRLGNRIKIGFSRRVADRLAALPYEEVLGVAAGTMADEARCHKIFAHLRTNGEWFEDTPELRAFITDVAQPYIPAA